MTWSLSNGHQIRKKAENYECRSRLRLSRIDLVADDNVAAPSTLPDYMPAEQQRMQERALEVQQRIRDDQMAIKETQQQLAYGEHPTLCGSSS